VTEPSSHRAKRKMLRWACIDREAGCVFSMPHQAGRRAARSRSELRPRSLPAFASVASHLRLKPAAADTERVEGVVSMRR
jgi:hypothetical protein